MIVISEATFSREVVVEKLQVSVLTKLLPVWFYLVGKLGKNLFP